MEGHVPLTALEDHHERTAERAVSQLYPGDLLENRYRIGAQIARGGMSTVYTAVDTRLDREVAVKVMDTALADQRSFRTRFEREARAVAKLNHPALVNVFDQGVDGDNVFLVMELVAGGSLRELLKERGPMPPHAALAVMEPVLTALSVAHSTGMIHRDIKPDNVLISEKHQVKLADFGLVRAIAQGVTNNAPTSSDGKVIGTVGYLSPEQVQGKSLHQASDVYSAGILLFELLTGVTPFKEDTPVATAMARLNRDVPAPSSLIDGVPPEIDALVARATAQDPAQRFSDGTAFLNAVHETSRELNLPAFNIPAPRASAVQHALDSADFGERLSWDDDSMSTRAVALGEAARTAEQDGHAHPVQHTAHTQLQPAGLDPQAGPEPYTPGVNAHNPNVAYPAGPPAAQEQPRPYPPMPMHHGAGGGEVASRRNDTPVSLSNRSPGRTAIWVLTLIAIVASVALGAWWLTSGRYGEIPSVMGMDQTTAAATVEDAGFTSSIDERYSNDAARQAVMGTDPPFGERAPRGSQVAVLVSLGKPTVPHPGPADTIASYTSKLEERTLRFELGTEVYSDDVPKGKIAQTNPPSGSEVRTDSLVQVSLSKGPRPVNVPGVKGKTEEQARQTLEKAGLEVGKVQREFNRTHTNGEAIRTRPGAGEKVPSGSEVTLVVSTAIEVPDVTGKSAEDARRLLREAGLNPVDGDTVTDRDVDAGDVAQQSPRAGDIIDPAEDGTDVEIRVSDAVRVPLVIGRPGDTARETLEQRGFRVDVDGPADGVVYSQSPGPGSHRQEGDKIVIKTF